MLPILACLFACGPAPVVVSVEAHTKSAPPAPGAEVTLVPADPRIPPTDPVYGYLAKVVSQALSQKGLRPAATAGEGRTVIAIHWLREGPKVITRTLMTPEPGDFRGVPRRTGDVQGLGRDQSLADLSPSNDPLKPNEQKVTRYPWTIELRGLRATGGEAALLWVVTASADSVSDDVADVAPELIAASMPLIGAEKARKDVRMSASDAAVKSLVVDSSNAGGAPPANARR